MKKIRTFDLDVIYSKRKYITSLRYHYNLSTPTAQIKMVAALSRIEIFARVENSMTHHPPKISEKMQTRCLEINSKQCRTSNALPHYKDLARVSKVSFFKR